MAQIKVGSGLTNPKSINVFRGGQWLTKKIGKVFRSGLWVDFIKYIRELYTNGVENVAWVIGQSADNSGYSKRSKYSTYMEIYIEHPDDTSTITTDMAYVTDLMIDLTPYRTLSIEWEGNGSGTSHLVADPLKNTWATTKTAGVTISGTFAKQVTTVDVSALTGNFYVRVHVTRTSKTRGVHTTKIHKVWAE